MEKIKKYVNHPLSKAIVLGLIGSGLLIEAHPMYAGIAFGVFLTRNWDLLRGLVTKK